MLASIYRSLEGQAEILRLYDEALSHLEISNESKTVSTRYGVTHVLSLGPEDAPPVVFPDPWSNPSVLSFRSWTSGLLHQPCGGRQPR